MQLQKPALVQTQRLKLSPQMLQSINIMALPLLDLKSRINQELEENPALDVIEDKEQLSLDSISERAPEESYFEDSSDPGFRSSSYDQAASDLKQGFMENALSQPETLREHLVWQLRLQPLSDTVLDLGELLILNLDMNGFHIEDPELLIPQEKHEVMRELMAIIQQFDPVGCCTENYLESLAVQASLVDDAPESILSIVRDHLPALDRGRSKDVAKKLSITLEEVERCLEILKFLTPFPGREYSRSIPNYVVPDLIVFREQDIWKIVINEDEIPVLGLNSFFNQVIQNNNESETTNFVKSKIRDAHWFINSIQQRHNTLKKVALAIVEYQRDFFLTGPKGIVPLTLKNVAGDVGVHEATISRLTRGKYMQTEFGIFELKYFFTNAVEGLRKGGGNYGKVAVKAIMKEILEAGKNLSDQKVSDLFEKRGIKIARRTVAKYRKELDISSSYER